MNPPEAILPVFALAPASRWGDLEDAISCSVNYQVRKSGKILPLMLFGPMTEAKNPDAREPMGTLPENLLMVSLARSTDAKVYAALDEIKGTVGEVHRSGACPLSIDMDANGLLADFYAQMATAAIHAFVQTYPHEDAPSFFLVRGKDQVHAFALALHKVTTIEATRHYSGG